jgi:hypothetical protein
MVGVDPPDMARTPQRFQPANMETDERLRVLPLRSKLSRMSSRCRRGR